MTDTITVWFCFTCRDIVQVGAKPEKCISCDLDEPVRPIEAPYVPEDDLLERIDDAMEDVLHKHYTLPDHECSCGAINNMDGDVLHGHRIGALSVAVQSVLVSDKK